MYNKYWYVRVCHYITPQTTRAVPWRSCGMNALHSSSMKKISVQNCRGWVIGDMGVQRGHYKNGKMSDKQLGAPKRPRRARLFLNVFRMVPTECPRKNAPNRKFQNCPRSSQCLESYCILDNLILTERL